MKRARPDAAMEAPRCALPSAVGQAWPDELYELPPDAEVLAEKRKRFFFVRVLPGRAGAVVKAFGGGARGDAVQHFYSFIADGPAPGGVIEFKTTGELSMISSRAASVQTEFDGEGGPVGAFYLFDRNWPAVKISLPPAGKISIWA